jgi:hypothetical protein
MQLSDSENANSFGCRRMISSCYLFDDALYGKYVPAFNMPKKLRDGFTGYTYWLELGWP